MCLDCLSNLTLRSKNSNVSVATSIASWMFLVGSTLLMWSKNILSWSMLCGQTIKILSLNIFQQIVVEVYCKGLTSKYWMAISLWKHNIWGPGAAPSLCKKCLILKMDLLHSKHNLRTSVMQAVGGNWSCLASGILLTYWWYQNLLTYNQMLMCYFYLSYQ